MKKTVTPGAIPQSWDSEALFGKAQRYAELMLKEDSDSWQHALWSSFSLELLSRAALANISPALLAENGKNNWHSLFHSLGFSPNAEKFLPKSITISEVLARLREILPEFDTELEKFSVVHTGKRNSELHSGETPFDGIKSSSWQPNFYRVAKVLLSSMGYKLEEFVGAEEAAVAEQLLDAAADEKSKAVAGDVAAFKKVWLAKDDGERSTLSISATAWATKHNGHRVECPSCNSQALVVGEAIGAPQTTLNNHEITETQEHLPSQFECIACGLKISGLSRLAVVELGDRYSKKQVYDAASYYEPEDYYPAYEEDNNE